MKTWVRTRAYNDRDIISTLNGINAVSYHITNLKFQRTCRIVFFSDLHMNKTISKSKSLADFINDFNPDHIIFGGDIVSFSSALDDAFAFLNMLRASGEKLSVIGNWELKKSRCKNISYWRTKYADSGFKLLNDSSLLAGKILFHGLSPSRGIYKKNEMETTDEKDFFSLMIAHTPDDIVSSKRYFNLALSGHTHGGQIRIPFIGALKTSSKHWKKFEYGLFTKDDNTQMIVSSGLGTSCFPVRLFCEPEIVVLDMKPC